MDSTREYYRNHAEEFFESTVTADVEPLYERFLKYVPQKGFILDYGCGSGRDSKAFREKGFIVSALDQSEELCKIASAYSDVDVKCADFLSLTEVAKYDAIWACASIIHAPSNQLPTILNKMREALVGTGVIFISFKNGDFEGERNGRYFVDMTSERFRSLLCEVDGLTMVEEWYSEDVRKDRDESWYSVILRKG